MHQHQLIIQTWQEIPLGQLFVLVMVVLMNNDKQPNEKKSSADSVEQHLQALEQTDDIEQLYYSQEQPFSSEELARLINEERLNELLAQGDAFLSSLSGEIEDFDEGSDKDNT